MTITWSEETRKLKDLIPYERNPRRINKLAFEKLCKSIEQVGYNNRLLVNLDNVVASGHQRLKALKKLGHKQVNVLVPDRLLTDAEFKQVMVTSNLNAGEFDMDIIANEYDVPLLLDWGFPEGLLPDYNMDVDAFEDEETIPETPKEAITKPGDIWILGEHRLMCGDSTKIDNVEILMNNKKADLVFTDPPYNLVEKNKLIAKNVHKSINRLNNSGWDKEFKILPVLDIIQNFTNKDCSVYIFTSNHLAGEIWLHFRSWADHYNWCVWSKTNPMPSLTKRHWTWSGELICYATKGKHVFNFPKEGNAYSIWEFGINTKDRGHPTAKPIEVCLHGILHSSNENQLILDLFGGSGSTLIACEKSKRKCLMMEIDPIYCDVIIARWEKLTGQKAQLERKINA